MSVRQACPSWQATLPPAALGEERQVNVEACGTSKIAANANTSAVVARELMLSCCFHMFWMTILPHSAPPGSLNPSPSLFTQTPQVTSSLASLHQPAGLPKTNCPAAEAPTISTPAKVLQCCAAVHWWRASLRETRRGSSSRRTLSAATTNTCPK